jgi:hypothetical protein
VTLQRREDVAVNVAKNGSEAYAWGGTYVIRMVLILAGLILSLAAAAAVFIRSVPVGLAMVLLLSGLLLRLSGAGMTFI